MTQRNGSEDTPRHGSLGQRIRKALDSKRRFLQVPPSRAPRRSLMMNLLRRAIYHELSRRPGLTSGELARALRTSRANVNWHLDKLVKARLVSRAKVGGRWAYLPANLLTEEELPVFFVLSNAITQRVYLAIRQRPGISQAKLSKNLGLPRQDLSWHLGKLSKAGLIATVLDGRFRRYSASPLFDEMARAHSRSLGRFKGTLISALKEDSLAPSIVKSLSSSMLIRMASGEGSSILEVVTDPYGTLLKAKERAKKLARKEK